MSLKISIISLLIVLITLILARITEILPFLRLKNIFSSHGSFRSLAQRISEDHSPVFMIFLFLLAYFLVLPVVLSIPFWLVNSSIIFALLFVLAPLPAHRFQATQVTSSDSIRDYFSNIYMRYFDIILLGIGIALSTGMTYNYLFAGKISFIWFLINIAASTTLQVLSLRRFLQTI
jgi:hypothetical protein